MCKIAIVLNAMKESYIESWVYSGVYGYQIAKVR